nr:fructosamine kinase family protein [Magnetospirillum sulfuroxidans]
MPGGGVGRVFLVELTNGGKLVAKLGPGLGAEGWMLRHLAAQTHLPVPHVVHDDDDLLLMEYVAGHDALDESAQHHAAHLLVALHGQTWHSFGLERDTVIGGLPQANPPTARWLDFFRDHRLLAMAGQALAVGHLPAVMMDGVERLAARLGNWIDEPARPALVHGDCWGGNILVKGGKIAAFIDPALYYGHAEMDLAFSTLFGTFGDAFFNRYQELSPLAPGFFEERKDLYLLYPLLVHVRLFGGSYVAGVERVLDRFH